MKTIDYYNHNAQEFYDRTIHADLTSKYNRFLEKLSPKAHILYAGCGSGRDTLHFLKQGYRVKAFDASNLEENFEILNIWKEIDNRITAAPSLPAYWLNFLVKKKD